MLKITMMLGSFDRLLGEANMAQAIDVARIVDEVLTQVARRPTSMVKSR